MMVRTAKCPRCGKTLRIRKDGCLPKHKDRPGGTTYSSWPRAEPCSLGGRPVDVDGKPKTAEAPAADVAQSADTNRLSGREALGSDDIIAMVEECMS